MKSSARTAVSGAAGQAFQILGRTALGGLCGVGLLLTLRAFWPASRTWIGQLGDGLELLARDQPAVTLGLILGTGAALLWQALRKP